MNETFYFSHDYDSMSDPKISALLSDFGSEGYGIYWAIIEMLHREELHKLELKPMPFKGLAKLMSTSVEQVLNIIQHSIDEYELFKIDENNCFFCDRVNRNISYRNAISEKRSKAGKASAEKRLEQMITHVEQNPTKEMKGKEIKENNNIHIPEFSEFKKYALENDSLLDLYSLELKYKSWKENDWHDGNNKKIKNWKSKLLSTIPYLKHTTNQNSNNRKDMMP